MKDLDLSKLRVDRSAPAAPAKRAGLSWRKIMLGGLALLLATALLWPKAPAVQTTQVVSAWPSQQFVLLNATGYVSASRKASVAPKGTGRVEWIGVAEGDEVKAGDLLARLESGDVAASHLAANANVNVAAASVRTATAELDDSQRNLDRANALFKKKLVSQLYLQDANSRLARADAAVASAKASLDAARANELLARRNTEYTQIRAPFDGVVISRTANVGDIVTPLASAADAKGAVLMMADMKSLEVAAEVSESSLSQIRVGQPCEIVLDAFPDKRLRGEVAVIVPTINRASATVTTKVRILDQDSAVLPDMSARVSFLSQPAQADQQPVLAVNPQAIVEQDGTSLVYAVDAEDKVRAVPVVVGATLGSVRAIQGPLKAGETVVLAPPKKLRDGGRIERGSKT